MADERVHLAQVNRYIADAKEHIRKQELDCSANFGGDVDEAESFLSILTDALTVLERQRLLILARLKP